MKQRLSDIMRRLDPYIHHPWFFPILMGVLGGLFALRTLHPLEQIAQRNLETVDILVSTRGLQARSILGEDDFTLAKIPKKYVPLGAVTAAQAEKIVHRSLLRPMAEGELFIWSSLDQEYTPEIPSGHISLGYRGISILVDEESAVSYKVRSGDRVDLLLTMEQTSKGKTSTVTLLQNVTILETGPGGDSTYSSLTLMVLPKEAALLRHAQSAGKLSLSLRNPHDQATARIDPYIDDETLLQTPFRQMIQQEHDESIEIIKKPRE